MPSWTFATRPEVLEFFRGTERNTAGAAKRLHLEQLPGYAPEPNPDEGIWNLLKRGELNNVCCRDLAHLATQLLQAKERLRHKQPLIRACIAQCGYQFEPAPDTPAGVAVRCSR